MKIRDNKNKQTLNLKPLTLMNWMKDVQRKVNIQLNAMQKWQL